VIPGRIVRIKQSPEDFVVEEIPAYEPSGEGSHLFVRFTKTGLTTPDAVRAIARALGCDPRAAGFAGMKDKHAVTTQSASFEAPRSVKADELADRARSLSLPGIVVHAATPHGHKMKPGHLAGNRFAIALRGIPAGGQGEVESGLARIARDGVPNAFGAQRFGRGGDNAERALAWLRGKEPGPRDPRMKRFLWSALQSAVFNAVLRARQEDGTWATPLEGDLLKLHSSGGLFLCKDVQTDHGRAEAGELSPTGPILGDRMRWPEGVPARLEHAIAEETLGADFDLSSTRRLGEGSRRALRLWVGEVHVEAIGPCDETGPRTPDDAGHQAACLRVCFVLPKGAYATTVLSAVVDVVDVGDAQDSNCY
jgi:tRNA pseudouridine13 synthase